VITHLGKAPVPSTVPYVIALRSHKPGDTVSVTLARGASIITTKVTLIEQPT
jgi:S1-C subfamily serine protease